MDLQNRAEAGGDGHDESVLNPEMPNETDLTKKERRRIEKEKLKGMGTGKKIQYTLIVSVTAGLRSVL